MDRGPWQAIVHRVSKSQIQLSTRTNKYTNPLDEILWVMLKQFSPHVLNQSSGLF